MAQKKARNRNPQSISQLMADSQNSFGKVLKRARTLSDLNQRISGLLDDDLARHCQVANIRDGRLIFACTSPGSATRLRMQGGQLLADLHSAGLNEIETIEVKMVVSRSIEGR